MNISSVAVSRIVFSVERTVVLVRDLASLSHIKYLMRFADLDEFLEEEIKGPAAFTCKTGSGCRFEEPAMNDLISDTFGDPAIFLSCDGGECLHYSQVPGYIVSKS